MTEKQVQHYAVDAQQISRGKADECDNACAKERQNKQRQILRSVLHGGMKALYRGIEVDEATDDQCQKIENDAVVVIVIVDELNIGKHDEHVEHADQPYTGALAGLYIVQRNNQVVNERIQGDTGQNKAQKNKGIVFIPEDAVLGTDTEEIDQKVNADKEQDGGGREDQLVKAFDQVISLLAYEQRTGLRGVAKGLALDAQQ